MKLKINTKKTKFLLLFFITNCFFLYSQSKVDPLFYFADGDSDKCFCFTFRHEESQEPSVICSRYHRPSRFDLGGAYRWKCFGRARRNVTYCIRFHLGYFCTFQKLSDLSTNRMYFLWELGAPQQSSWVIVDNIGPWNSPSFNTGWKTTFPESSSSHGPDTGRSAGPARPDS